MCVGQQNSSGLKSKSKSITVPLWNDRLWKPPYRIKFLLLKLLFVKEIGLFPRRLKPLYALEVVCSVWCVQKTKIVLSAIIFASKYSILIIKYFGEYSRYNELMF